jgi:hypothetical protein
MKAKKTASKDSVSGEPSSGEQKPKKTEKKAGPKKSKAPDILTTPKADDGWGNRKAPDIKLEYAEGR